MLEDPSLLLAKHDHTISFTSIYQYSKIYDSLSNNAFQAIDNSGNNALQAFDSTSNNVFQAIDKSGSNVFQAFV